jgi:pyridoxine kinase
MAHILALSSQVVRGHVGLGATVPALHYLGHEVWAVPTVLLASRPGLGRLVRYAIPARQISAVLDALGSDGCWSVLGAVFAGYFPSPRSVTAAARAIAAIKAERPGIVVFIDPILGDAGRLYVAAKTADAVRRELVPLASVVSPNRFELEWLTGASVRTLAEAVAAARRLGPARVVVTSAVETEEAVTTLLVDADDHFDRSLPRRAAIANGVGDLFAGLLLGRLLEDVSARAALEASLTDLDRVLRASERRPVLRLAALRPWA